ncbi:MAG: hypothetical protein L0I70_10385 [Lactococcus lactis]|nr:hypothetical protein [Lactococcus lactis]MDN6079705.1 hypothetical protein [Lactococcus lactis]
MKKIILWGLTFLVILTISSCSKNKNSKYDSVISDLKSELAVKGDSKLTFDNYEWSYKVVHNVTNADISKGDMIEVYPKKERDSKRLFNINIDSQMGDSYAQSKIIVLQKIVSKIAKKLPNDNSEITLGFKSQQKSKRIVPVARSLKSMDAFPIND